MPLSPSGEIDADDDQVDAEPRYVPGGRYRLLTEIGRGSAAVVYRGHDVQLGRSIAVKVFHLSPSGIAPFSLQQAELTTLASLNHPGIVTLFDSGTDLSVPDRPRGFLVMEDVVGVDLRRHLANGPIAVAEIADIAGDVVDAMRYMHEHEVVHRDIKPANILLVADPNRDGRMRAKLSDFGTALIPGGTVEAELSSGTAAYLSPEQAAGEQAGPASDMFSLGLVLLECFTGQVAYPGSATDSIRARLESPPRIPEGVPRSWRELLGTMTARLPEDRPTAKAVRELLADGHGRSVPRHRLDVGE